MTRFPSPQRRLSWQQVYGLYEAGFTLAECAQMSGFHASTIRDAMIRDGVPRRPPGLRAGRQLLPHDEIRRTVFLYEHAQWSIREVAEHLGLNYQTVWERLERAGVKRRTVSEALHIAYRRGRKRPPPGKRLVPADAPSGA